MAGQDVAGVVVGAVGWVEGSAAVDERNQFVFEGAQLFDGAADMVEFGVEEFGDVGAGGRAFVAEFGDPADFVEGEPGCLGVTNEREAVECVVVVVAVSARRSFRFAKESESFVEANGPWMDAGVFRKFADPHPPKVSLDLLL